MQWYFRYKIVHFCKTAWRTLLPLTFLHSRSLVDRQHHLHGKPGFYSQARSWCPSASHCCCANHYCVRIFGDLSLQQPGFYDSIDVRDCNHSEEESEAIKATADSQLRKAQEVYLKVLSSEFTLKEENLNQAIDDWDKRHAQAVHLFMMSISEAFKRRAINCSDLTSAWRNLEQNFDARPQQIRSLQNSRWRKCL